MQTAENIYECEEHLLIKTTHAESNLTGLNRKKKGEEASSNTHPETDGSAGKYRKRYADCLES